MQKKTLRTILIVVVLAILAYQTWAGEESREITAPAAAPATSVQAQVDIESPTVEQADGDFDYWVMALSWSPDYCATNDYEDEQQCSIGRQLDFVLHGLWPQYDKGYPSYCSTEELPYELKVEYAGLYPNDNLFDHEWEKHGTCSGLTFEGYLEWSETLKDGLVIPPEFDSPLEPFRSDAESLQAAFVEANPNFVEDAIAVYCSGSGRFLKEIYVCYEKDGEPRACSDEVLNKAAKSCGQPDFLVRSTR